eukprot:TRINITY_DN28939_c0_g1_i1.p1 TRINITY_DN28939_c0_g1~~TRINITY_DN28939_c0_g1_i1.p1  ORF type:complete len:133 (+),score=11.67 TRINITY_DN28939_c0_g1_i1:157-555(+)
MAPETPKTDDFADLDDYDAEDKDGDDSDYKASRRNSVSMSESMSMSQSTLLMSIPSNIPRKSFKKISYNWNDSISTKSFNNYKKLRQKFAFRYSHTPKSQKMKNCIKFTRNYLVTVWLKWRKRKVPTAWPLV